MMIQKLEAAMSRALDVSGVELPEGFQLQVEAAADLRFGDYQSNAAMVLAKRLRTNPRELAAKLIEVMDIGDLAVADIAGPGFINFRVSHLMSQSRCTWATFVRRLLAIVCLASLAFLATRLSRIIISVIGEPSLA